MYYSAQFKVDEFSLKVIEEKMKSLGIDDIGVYLDKVLSDAMKSSEFKRCPPASCKIERKVFHKSITKNKSNFIECLAYRNKTTRRNIIMALLLSFNP